MLSDAYAGQRQALAGLPCPERSSKRRCYSFTFLYVDALPGDDSHAGADAGRDSFPGEIQQRPVGTSENRPAQPVILFFRFGVKADGNGVKACCFQFCDNVPAGIHQGCMAIGIQPDGYSPLVQPLGYAEHRIKPASGLAETGKNHFFIFRKFEAGEFADYFFLRRFPGKTEVVAVNAVAVIPDAEYTSGAALVGDVEVKVAERFITDRILAGRNVFVPVRRVAVLCFQFVLLIARFPSTVARNNKLTG